MRIEPEGDEDQDVIRNLNIVAFEGRTEEADLVDGLRNDGDLVLSLVARHEGSVVGHIAFSRVAVETARGPTAGISLAPVAVHPAMQNRGIGRKLIESGLRLLADSGESVVLVVGNPAYYERFGFSVELGDSYPCEYSGPYLLALHLAEGAPSGAVTYPEAFGLVS